MLEINVKYFVFSEDEDDDVDEEEEIEVDVNTDEAGATSANGATARIQINTTFDKSLPVAHSVS